MTLGLALTVMSSTCAIALEHPGCAVDWIELGEVERLVCVELARSSTAAIAIAGSSCDERVLSASIGARELRIPLADVPRELRPRVAALSIVERLREPPLPPVLPAPVKTATIASVVRPQPVGVVAPIWISARASVRAVPRYEQNLLGVAVSLAIPIYERTIYGAISAGYERASKQHALGDLSLDVALLAFSARAARSFGPIELAIGPRLELGSVWAAGTAAVTTTIERAGSGVVILGGLELLATLRFDERASIFLALEGGVALRGFDSLAAVDRAVGFGGLHGGAAIGISFDLAAGVSTRVGVDSAASSTSSVPERGPPATSFVSPDDARGLVREIDAPVEERNCAKAALTAGELEEILAVAEVIDVLNTRHAIAKERDWAKKPPSKSVFAKAVLEED